MLAGVFDCCKITTRYFTLTPPPPPPGGCRWRHGPSHVCGALWCPHLRRTHVVLIDPFALSACLSPSTTSLPSYPPPPIRPAVAHIPSLASTAVSFIRLFFFFLNETHSLFQISDISCCQLLWIVSPFFSPAIWCFFSSFSHLFPWTCPIFLHSDSFWKVFLRAHQTAVTAGCTISRFPCWFQSQKQDKINKKNSCLHWCDCVLGFEVYPKGSEQT